MNQWFFALRIKLAWLFWIIQHGTGRGAGFRVDNGNLIVRDMTNGHAVPLELWKHYQCYVAKEFVSSARDADNFRALLNGYGYDEQGWLVWDSKVQAYAFRVSPMKDE